MGWWVLLLDRLTDESLSQRTGYNEVICGRFIRQLCVRCGTLRQPVMLAAGTTQVSFFWRPNFNFSERRKISFCTLKILSCNHTYFGTQFLIPHQRSSVRPSKWYRQTDAVGLLSAHYKYRLPLFIQFPYFRAVQSASQHSHSSEHNSS